MRNLRIARVESRRLCLSSEEHLTLAAPDASRGQIVFATSAASLICITRDAHEVVWTLPVGLDNDSIKDHIVGMDFMMDNEVLVVGTECGELFSISVPTLSVEVVGNVEGGVVQMSASPDGELLAIATGLGMLLLMTSDWEVLYEIPLDEHIQSEDGSRKPTVESINQASELVRISWRSDGKFFATLGGSTSFNSAKELRIWERDTGTLHACSKALSSSSLVLDWIPSGSRLASVYSQDAAEQAARVIFFERNGLERGSFDVHGPGNVHITYLKWNCNSELLAMLLRCGDVDVIQTWSFCNYHWYLKQEWRYSKENCINFCWDPEKPMHLYIWTMTGLVQLVSLCWDSAVTGDSVALVVDGPCLLITPLTLGVVPPPMSLFKLKFHASICAISLHQKEGDCLIAASLSSGAISLVALPSNDKWDVFEGTESLIPDASFLEHTEAPPCMRLFGWLNSGNLLSVVSSAWPVNSSSSWQVQPYLSSEVLVELEPLRGQEYPGNGGLCGSGWSCKCINRTILDKRVLAITNHPLKSGLLIHLEDGSFSFYDSTRGLVEDDKEDSPKSLIHPSLWIQALAATDLVIVGLDVQGKLQVDSRLITNDCTSFAIHTACINGKKVIHMLHTTKRDVLHIENFKDVCGEKELAGMVHDISSLTSKEKGELDFGYKNQGKKDILKTRTVWERGARLVTAIGGHGAAVIMQTLRGNLETIYPRNLVIGSIVSALCDSKFNEAVLLARRHHINLNLIVDFGGWKAFVQQSVEFIRQVKNLNHVTELVCAVSAGSYVDSIYQDMLLPYMKEIGKCKLELPTSNEPTSLAQRTKVQCVMHAIRKALEDEVVASPKRELCILTTMARSDPPELEEALIHIKKLREEEMNCLMLEEETDNASKRLSAEEAMKHLLWLSDSKSVFNAALGLYDLHLAAMVASNSQGDPKEFLPLLQDLENMPLPLMRYSIDYKLQRFDSALKNLASAGSSHFSKCLELMRDNPSLFPLGKHLFQVGPERMAVIEAWGDYLVVQKRFEDAAVAFSSCSQLHKSLGAYRASGQWQCVLVVAGVLQYSREEVIKLAHDLKEELQALGRPGDAAKIALEYCKDPEDAVYLFIEAREWMEAVRISYLCEKVESMKDQVQAAALECAASHMTDFEDGLEKVGKYLARYLAVKQRRVLLQTKLKNGNAEDIEDDAASDVSSNVSGMSVYTTGTRSSKVSLQASNTSTKDRKQTAGKSRGGKIRAGSPLNRKLFLKQKETSEETTHLNLTGLLKCLGQAFSFLVCSSTWTFSIL